MSESPFLTIEQAAERAQVSRGTIKKWMREGLPKIQMSPRMVRFRIEVFDSWIEDHFTVGDSAETSQAQAESGSKIRDWQPVEKIRTART